MKTGPLGGSLDLLTQEEMGRIHIASMRLLAEHGLQIESDLILQTFRQTDADVDLEARRVRLPAELVDAALRSAPTSFMLHGRDPAMDLRIEPGRVYFGMGGTSEPFLWDYQQGVPRQPTIADMVACTRVGQASPNVDFVMALCSAGDVPKDEVFFHEYDALFRNTTKPIVYTAPGQRYAARFLEMAAAASGGEETLRRRPCVVIFSQPVSPLVISRYSEGMFEAARLGVPILFSPGPMMGATSPATLAGSLVQVNAEALFGIVLSQVIRTGTPVIYGPHTAVMDMVTAQCTYGSAEQTLARAAVAQLARFYHLPSFGLGGGVEAKLPDAEAASQAMMGMLVNALSGLTLTQTLGTLASGLYGAPEMLLICDEIAHMVKRILGGIKIDEETLALSVIEEVGCGGNFLAHDHTAQHFRAELFFPVLFRRQSIAQWQESGGRSIVDHAHERVRAILEQAGPVSLPNGADQHLERILREAIAEAKQGAG